MSISFFLNEGKPFVMVRISQQRTPTSNRDIPRGDNLILDDGGVIADVAIFASNGGIGVHVSNRRRSISYFFQCVVVLNQDAAVSIPIGA